METNQAPQPGAGKPRFDLRQMLAALRRNRRLAIVIAVFVLAVLVVNEGQRKIQSRSLPAAFRGLPITLIYIGILALAIYGFTGHTPAI